MTERRSYERSHPCSIGRGGAAGGSRRGKAHPRQAGWKARLLLRRKLRRLRQPVLLPFQRNVNDPLPLRLVRQGVLRARRRRSRVGVH